MTEQEKRKKIEKLVLDVMKVLDTKDSGNYERYDVMFKSMTDKEFAELVQFHANLVKLVEYFSRKFDGRYSVGSKNKKVLDYYKLKFKEL